MSLFEELLARFKEEQAQDEHEKNVRTVTCTRVRDKVNRESTPDPEPLHTPVTRARVTNRTKSTPGDCDNCEACGHWDSHTLGPGRYCFYEPYFVGRSGKPQLAKERQNNCPLNKEGTVD